MSSIRPTAPRCERDSPVLRLPALGDVELGEHLQAGRDAVRHPLRNALDLVEHAVDAHAHEQCVLLRLEVDVARAVGGGLHDDRVDEPDERCIGDAVVDLEVVLRLVDDIELVEGRLGLEHLRSPRDLADLGEDVVAARNADLDRVAAGEPELVDAVDVARVGDRDPEPVALPRDGDRDDALERQQRDELGRVRRHPLLLEVDERQVVAPGERSRDALGLSVALVAQRLGERAGAGTASGRGEPVAWDDLGRRDELGDEIGDGVEPAAGRPGSTGVVPARSPRFVDVRSGPAGSKFMPDSLDRGIGTERDTCSGAGRPGRLARAAGDG